MPAYKLCYYNAKGLAEMSRLLFAEAEVQYEDIRYTNEEWQEQKSNMLFHQIPVLFVDGEQIAHSRAAFRYLCKEFKLDGGSSLNAAKLDMWLESLFEAAGKLPFQETDEDKKAELVVSAFKDFIHPRLSKFEEQVKATEGVFAFGEKISGIDIAIYACVDQLKDYFGEAVMEPHPILSKLMEAVEARPNIAKWIKERPCS